MHRSPRSVVEEQSAWEREDCAGFFTTARVRPEDLYVSEKLVLPVVLQHSRHVLDVGCAAGGFSSIMRHYNPHVRYVGVDVIHSLLTSARERSPEAFWLRCDAARLPFCDRAFDAVWSSGIMHLNSAYPAILEEGWRVAGEWMAFDFRVALPGEGGTTGTFHLDFGGDGPDYPPLPYHVLSREELGRLVSGLSPAPARVRIVGYPAPVSPMARDVPEEVLMVFVMAQRTSDVPAEDGGVVWDIRARSEFSQMSESEGSR